ncbi:hypothetical protein [Cellulosimicrobium sp. 22601]|uniref:hypothetical protein n=1 Tax=unclassified Cellulosimicrobium TaxID=2624466 RepID=UPI003F830425
MTIKNNPHGVGYSGEGRWRDGALRCRCCALAYPGRYNVEDGERAGICPKCVDHLERPDEDPAARVDRAEAHAGEYWLRMKRAATDAAERKQEVEEARRRVRSALETRAGYRRLLAEVANLHRATATGCSCGVKRCRTLAALDRSGGYGREVRDLADSESRWAAFRELAEDASQRERLGE